MSQNFKATKNTYNQILENIGECINEYSEENLSLENLVHSNVVFFGGNASGKTTLLRAILKWIPVEMVANEGLNVTYLPITRTASAVADFSRKNIAIGSGIDTIAYFRNYDEIEKPNNGNSSTAIENCLDHYSDEISKELSSIFSKEIDISLENYQQLSDGYLSILSIICNVIYYSETFHSKKGCSFLELTQGIVGLSLIDEIDSFIHQTIQLKILDVLTLLFPNVFFVLTTHSPSIVKGSTNFKLINISENYKLTEVAEFHGQSYDFIVDNLFSDTNEFSLFTEYIEIRNLILSGGHICNPDNYLEKLKSAKKSFYKNDNIIEEISVLIKILELSKNV